MTMLKRFLVACAVAGLVLIPSFAEPGREGSGDVDQVQARDNTCENVPGECDGTGAGQLNTGRGRGNGRRGRMGWRGAQGNRQRQRALAMGELTEAEVTHVLYMRQEEKLARDVYITFDEWWLADVFERITVSEQRHLDAVGRIIEAQGLTDPAADDTVGQYGDEAFVVLYNELTGGGKTSYAAALKVGAYIEELDILDLLASLEDVENAYLVQVFQNLMRGSRNHLRAFVSELEGEGETYVPQLMTAEQYEAIINSPVERGPGRGRRGGQGAGNRQ